eukprot:TRINITY_DN2621_c0_g1_i2.p1 TRINITY_DN2621_c0_g1~~TRINITY_DN2621_c0_g1_i2.p1  ORF type:complete len:285 (+),score=52.90 TRINITY_DN2621_c0_g1_i2:64-918(+)
MLSRVSVLIPRVSHTLQPTLKSFGPRILAVGSYRTASSVPQGETKASHEYHRHSTWNRPTSRDMLAKLDTDFQGPLPHYKPITLSDKVGYYMVKLLRNASKVFYRQKYTHYACTLETVAAVPGMAAGMLHHLRSLRRMEHNVWVKTLLDEAENERMHLMAFIEITKPTWIERMFVMSAQGFYFTAFSIFYMISERTAHRFTGYLEEEAVKSYTEMLADIDAKRVPNPPAPQIAKDYWNLPEDATLRDMVLVIRADEMDHRDVNHGFSDVIDTEKRSGTKMTVVH